MNNEFSTERQDCAVKISPLAYNIIERIKIIRQSQGDSAVNIGDIASEAIIKAYQFEVGNEPINQAEILNKEQKENLRTWMLSQTNQNELVEFCSENKISFLADITVAQAEAVKDFEKKANMDGKE